MYCQHCGAQLPDTAKFCTNCGQATGKKAETIETPQTGKSSVKTGAPQLEFNDRAKKSKKPKKSIFKRWWFWVLAFLVLISLVFGGGSSSSKKTPSEAANNLNNSVKTETPTPKSTETPAVEEIEPEPEEELLEINPGIPLGTSYELDQGEYECGPDIPAGRYLIEWISGNQFGGYVNAKNGCKYLDTMVSIDPGEPYTCVLSAGDCFEIQLSKYRFTKITSLPNDNYRQSEGSYVLGQGYFFEGIDIPEGKYNVTAVSGNPFGIYLSTRTKSMIPLEQGETYNNLRLDNTGSPVHLSLGSAEFKPVG